MKQLRVLVVEDSLTVRKRLCEILEDERDIVVVGEAADGKQAIELCEALRPDVISMDMMLPIMTGLAATEYIMAHCPTPILVVSASLNRGELFRTYDAVAAGAVDMMEKPGVTDAQGDWDARYLSTLRLVARVPVITHLRARSALRAAGPPPAHKPTRPQPPVDGRARSSLIALGASTGGPGALVDVLGALPRRLQVPVLVVMHINEPFAIAFSDWLDAQTPHRVSYAKDGEPLASCAGRVLLAPADRHMVVGGGQVRLDSGPARHSCRPSVDTLFESIAVEAGSRACAALLTGMGRDGATGLLAIRRAGGATIAQDEASSVIYGMPREAALLGAAERVLPLDQIGTALATLCGVPSDSMFGALR
ncbi:chemotaxis-specific protein-glutamate methyltransferase CheB [Paucibacter sp. R3-3]|uniref:Protein-glutamate methylesterase/protein-glutamine glutaminase n=1 Tax=Roseateles agri TaxID=3098619 RepID=A0ABU5DS10_9BURK|nr:chemotaxis-specific protein-glutamate methyltransferase CheB [Paucibacter sp. R3-3]MDY0749110.1 chemotaxis-specific protein-glutamate methyltransferase CheB [Paucibacter sp. R3-3]